MKRMQVNIFVTGSCYFINVSYFLPAYRICRNKRPPDLSALQKHWFFKGGSTQNRWLLMSDFSQGGVHKTDGFWWVIFQRGEYIQPNGLDGWFFKGGSTQNRWILMGDFTKGGLHTTEGSWWVIFQRGEYTKPMASDGWFFKGGSTHNRRVLMGFGIYFIASKN